MRALKIVFVALVAWAVLFGLVMHFASAPDCQTMWNPHFTGTQTIDGHRVDCFHGNVVRVEKGRS